MISLAWSRLAKVQVHLQAWHHRRHHNQRHHGGNDKVVARLLGGLKKFGAPDYRRDDMGNATVP